MRIVSLLPSATEIVCALGLEASLVGISHECDFPTRLSTLPRLTASALAEGMSPIEVDNAVSTSAHSEKPLYSLDYEALDALAPDLILTQGVCDVCALGESVVQQYIHATTRDGRSIQVLSLDGVTFEGVLRDIGKLGELTGRFQQSRELVLRMQARLSAVKALPSLPSTPRVLMLEWPEPVWTAGHWVPELVAAAGGNDVFGVAGAASRRVSWDEVVLARPDIIISIACGHGLEQNLEFANRLREIEALAAVPAVQTGRVFAADANSYFSRPGPRMVRGAELIAHALERPGALVPEATELVRAF